MSTETDLRDSLALHGRSLYERGLSPGTSGNLSVRMDDGLLVTPTGSCLGRLDPGRISRVDHEGRHLSGDAPTKEAFLYEVYTDAAAFDAHQKTDHFASFGERVADMVEEKTVQTWNRVGGAGGA